MDKESRITSMTFLNEFTEGDQERISKYVKMYLGAADQNLSQLGDLLAAEQWDQLRVLVHSMKPHFDFMGMKKIKSLAEEIEALLVDKEDLNIVPAKVAELQKGIEQSIDELQA